VLHEGPLGEDKLARRVARSVTELGSTLSALLADGRVERRPDGLLVAHIW
jgi:hypothetical protein